jgi:hypothetical protein
MGGTRQGMTRSNYDAMTRMNDAESNQWKRFNLDGKLTNLLETLSTLHRGPEQGNGVLEKVLGPVPAVKEHLARDCSV